MYKGHFLRCLNSFFPLCFNVDIVFCVLQIAESKVSFVAVAEAIPVVSALTSSGKDSSGLIIVGPEGG
jgi:hypothetical protein